MPPAPPDRSPSPPPLSPAAVREYTREFYMALIAASVGIALITAFVLMTQGALAGVIAMGLIGAAMVFIGGTRVMIPVYFATTFGTVINIGLPISLNRAAALGLFAAAVLELPRLPVRWFWSGATVAFLAFQAYYLTTAELLRPAGSSYPVESLFYLFLSLVLVWRYWEERWMHHLLVALVFTTGVLIIPPGIFEMIFWQDLTVSGVKPFLDRINGLSLNSIVYGFTALWSVPITATLLVQSRSNFMRLVYAALVLGFVFFALMTMNRQTPFILTGMGLVYIVMLRSNLRVPIFLMMVAGSLAAAPLIAPRLIDRLSQVRNVSSDPSLAFRHDKANIAWNMLNDHWWFGVGHNYFKDLWKQYKPPGEMVIVQYVAAREHYIDMGYLQILTEYGVVGATLAAILILATIALIAKYYRLSRRLEDTWHSNMIAACAAIFTQLLLSLFIQDNWMIPRVYMMYGILFATCYAVNRRLAEQPSGAPPAEPAA